MTDHGTKKEFELAKLGDPHREQRLLALAEAMSRVPDKSFPEALSSAELEGAYRFFSNPKVDPDAGARAAHAGARAGRAGESVAARLIDALVQLRWLPQGVVVNGS